MAWSEGWGAGSGREGGRGRRKGGGRGQAVPCLPLPPPPLLARLCSSTLQSRSISTLHRLAAVHPLSLALRGSRQPQHAYPLSWSRRKHVIVGAVQQAELHLRHVPRAVPTVASSRRLAVHALRELRLMLSAHKATHVRDSVSQTRSCRTGEYSDGPALSPLQLWGGVGRRVGWWIPRCCPRSAGHYQRGGQRSPAAKSCGRRRSWVLPIPPPLTRHTHGVGDRGRVRLCCVHGGLLCTGSTPTPTPPHHTLLSPHTHICLVVHLQWSTASAHCTG